jgi:hypothetical protein
MPGLLNLPQANPQESSSKTTFLINANIADCGVQNLHNDATPRVSTNKNMGTRVASSAGLAVGRVTGVCLLQPNTTKLPKVSIKRLHEGADLLNRPESAV